MAEGSIGQAFLDLIFRPPSPGTVQTDAQKALAPAEAAAKSTATNVATALAAGFSTVKLIAFGKESVAAFQESERASLDLAFAFETSAKLADSNTDAITALAEANADLTRFDDDATKAAAAHLAQFKLSEDQLLTLIPLVQDYAARTGRDLVSAADVAGKAVLGQGRALKEVGIEFEDTGNRTENFTQLVGKMREQVGGFAEQEGQSAAGQAAILANNFGELQEMIGAVIQKGLTPLVGAANAAIDTFQAAPAALQTATAVVATFGGTALTTVASLATIQAGLRTVSPSVNVFSAALKAIPWVAAIAGAAEFARRVGDEGLGGALSHADDSLDRFISESKQLADGVPVDELNAGAEGVQTFGRALQLSTQVQDGFSEAALGGAEALREQADAARKDTDELRALRDAQLALSGGLIAVLQASDDAAEAQAELNRLRERGKEGTDKYRDAEFAALTTTLSLKESIREQAQAMGEAGVKAGGLRAQLQEVGKAGGLTREEVNRLVTEGLNLLPKRIRIPFETPGLDAAIAKVNELLRTASAPIDPIQVTTILNTIQGRGVRSSSGVDRIILPIAATGAALEALNAIAEQFREALQEDKEASRELERVHRQIIRLRREEFEATTGDARDAIRERIKDLEKEREQLNKHTLAHRQLIETRLQEGRELEREGTRLHEFVSGLKDTFKAFREGVRDALAPDSIFAGLDDISGAGIAGALSGQVLDQQALIDAINNLVGQGASGALITDLLGQGDQALPIAQALLEAGEGFIEGVSRVQDELADKAREAAGDVGFGVFGERLSNANERLAEFADEVRAFKGALDVPGVRNQVDRFERLIERLNNALENLPTSPRTRIRDRVL